MQMLYARADWRNPKNYPARSDTNATMWAWEFLRRNLTYQVLFDRVTQAEYKNDTERQEEEARLAVAWNLSKLLDPRKSYHELEQQEDKPLDDFYVTGQQPEVVLPVIDQDEIYLQQEDDAALLMNAHIIACSEQSTYLAPNEVLLRVCLDGDIDLQIDRFKQWLNDSREIQSAAGVTERHQIRRLRAYNISEPENDKQKSILQNYLLPAQQKRVHYTNLWYALRIVDAIATQLWEIAKEGMADHLDDAELSEIEGMIRETFNNERIDGLKVKSMKPTKFNDYKSFGIWYSLSKRYVALAHADLESQVKGYRRKPEEK